MSHFWNDLNTPIITLAPLADVTDTVFRRMIAKYSKWNGELPDAEGGLARPHAKPVGGPDVMWTEFVSADGLMRAPEEGRQKLLADLMYTEAERPIVAQLFTSTPEHMEGAARLCAELGFDGVDINMGCPDRSVEKQGAGAAMIKNPTHAREVIRAAKRGAGALPVSVKTRLGYNADELEDWLSELLAEEPAVVTLHARTRKEMSKVPARWERIGRAVEIRDALDSSARILGNGDVTGLEDAYVKIKESGADGAMLGRAIFGNPWLFAGFAHTPCGCKTERPLHTSPKDIKRAQQVCIKRGYGNRAQSRNSADPALSSESAGECACGVLFCEVCGGYYISPMQRLDVMAEHTELFEELLPHKNFAIMKKHYKAYVNGFDGAKELRTELMETNSAQEVREIVERAKKTF